MQVLESLFNRSMQQPEWFKGRGSRRLQKLAYLWSKHQDGAIDLIMYGRKYGSYPFTNKESIIINTAQAGTNEQVLVNASGAPTSGGFQLQWTNPDMGMTCVTQELAWNATAATVQTAINTLPNFTGTCTVTGGPIGTGFTVTFSGGGYQNRPLNNDGFCLRVRDEYKRRGLEEICSWRKGAMVQEGYILPKNRSLSRERPIVSFAGFGGGRLGGWVA